MPLPMQGHELLPGVQNIASCGVRPGTPDRGRGDTALEPCNKLGKIAASECRNKFGAGKTVFRRAVVGNFAGVVGENVNQRILELSRIGMAKFRLGQFLHVIVHEPRMIEHSLQDERFAARYRRAMSAMYRTCRQVRTYRD